MQLQSAEKLSRLLRCNRALPTPACFSQWSLHYALALSTSQIFTHLRQKTAQSGISFPVSSKISDFTPCAHAQSNILHIKCAAKTDSY